MRRPSYSAVMSTVAVFIALGGTGYAVTSLPRGSVGTIQLQQDAVTGPKVLNGSLSGRDLQRHSVRANRLRGLAGAIRAHGGGRGPTGPQGPPGPPSSAKRGPTGPRGVRGPTGA